MKLTDIPLMLGLAACDGQVSEGPKQLSPDEIQKMANEAGNQAYVELSQAYSGLDFSTGSMRQAPALARERARAEVLHTYGLLNDADYEKAIKNIYSY